MPRRATIEEILQTGETELAIPGYFDDAGDPLTLRVRKVHAGERLALSPSTPGHLFKDLPEDPDPATSTPEQKRKVAEQRRAELMAREQRWLDSLTPEQLDERRLDAADFCCRLIALAAVEPKLTREQARCLGDAAVELAERILEFSQNKPKSDDQKA